MAAIPATQPHAAQLLALRAALDTLPPLPPRATLLDELLAAATAAPAVPALRSAWQARAALQPHVTQAATLRGEGCNPMRHGCNAMYLTGAQREPARAPQPRRRPAQHASLRRPAGDARIGLQPRAHRVATLSTWCCSPRHIGLQPPSHWCCRRRSSRPRRPHSREPSRCRRPWTRCPLSWPRASAR